MCVQKEHKTQHELATSHFKTIAVIDVLFIARVNLLAVSYCT
jgi:hypothetical protein